MNKNLPKDTAQNSIFSSCPALSYSGRHGTVHIDTHDLTNHHMKMMGYTNSNYYREFLQQNGSELMKYDRNDMKQNFDCAFQQACTTGYQQLIGNSKK